MAKKEDKIPSYSAKDIYVLEGLEPVRKRPGMYIGSTGPDGLHHLVWEVVDNSIDEAIAGYAKNIIVELLPDNRVAVTDDGRGIPVEKHGQTGLSALETVMTKLHAGGKFGGESYKISGGLHGVGVSVVNALSSHLRVEVCRDSQLYVQEYKRGKPTSKVKKAGKCRLSGTKVTFEADSEVFAVRDYNLKRILDHLRQQAYLTKGIKIEIIDRRAEPEQYFGFYFDNGIKSFIRHLSKEEQPLQVQPFYAEKTVDGICVEAALVYSNELESKELSFANNIHTPDGGMHLTGFRSALTRVINDFGRSGNYLKSTEENLTGDDVREGLIAIISVKLREPQFEGQTKARLGNPEARTAVESVVGEALKEFLERESADGRRILEKCLLASKARKAARAAKEAILRKGVLEGLSLPGKLADCSSRRPEESELFIVEGDSAGGCFSSDTKVALADGRNLSFKELIKEDKRGVKNYCYTVDKNGLIAIEKIINPRLTRKNAEVMEVILDNNEKIVCTPDHKFMLADGSFREAQYLIPSNSLMPLYRKYSKIGGRITIDGYEMIFDHCRRYWIFTHLLADDYNLRHHIYSQNDGFQRHHRDFNKLNNNPDNVFRLSQRKHFKLHQEIARVVLQSPEVLKKLKLIRQTPEYREKVRQTMLAPKMRKMLSERAKRQWQDGNYKDYMTRKFLDFYYSNEEYRKKNSRLLNKVQKIYWNETANRIKQADRVKKYFASHPEKRRELSELSKKQWQDMELRKWRGEKTKGQWSDSFRAKRRRAYNQTYCRKALEKLRDVYDKKGMIDVNEYQKTREATNDKSLLRYGTILKRYFNDNEEKLVTAVKNFNHKIRQTIRLKEKINVYDLEVPRTHNFALASGVFVHNSSKMGRDRRTQAILPLKGKILNVEKARIDKMLINQEIKSLVIALGTAIAESFDLSKLRYHKVIIMTDADVDGAHIRTLLLTLFYRYFPSIIENGHLYIAQPPLYRIQKGKEAVYAYKDKEKDELMAKWDPAGDGRGINIQRYKGLGEMNADQLWETTLDPQNRVLKKVAVTDAQEADRLFDILMGVMVEPRKHFIQSHALAVKNLDV